MPKKRKQEKRSAKRVLRIFCEGEKTEPLYLKGYIQDRTESARKRVIQIEATRKNTPVQLVKEACKFLDGPASIAGDEVWVVYDREAAGKYSEELHAQAYEMARRRGINVALSNVCFEYWVLLHFIDTTSPYSSFDDLIQRSPLNQFFVRQFGEKYSKASGKLYDLLKPFIDDARKRAQSLCAHMEKAAPNGKDKPFHLNPYTNIHELLDNIDSFK
jgi:hypothetical protein